MTGPVRRRREQGTPVQNRPLGDDGSLIAPSLSDGPQQDKGLFPASEVVPATSNAPFTSGPPSTQRPYGDGEPAGGEADSRGKPCRAGDVGDVRGWAVAKQRPILGGLAAVLQAPTEGAAERPGESGLDGPGVGRRVLAAVPSPGP